LIAERISAHQDEYDKAKAEMEAQKINLKLLEPLQTRIQDVDRRLSQFAEFDGKITEGRARRRDLVSDLRTCRASQSSTYLALAEVLTASTRERVRMQVVRAGDVRKAVSEFQDQIGDKRRFKITDAEELAKTILEATLQRGEGTHPATLWTELIDHLLGHFEAAQDEALGRASTDEPGVGCDWVGPLLERLHDLVADFDDQKMGHLLCQHVPDSMKMELRRKVDAPDYISISDASLGQKATALFLILLAQTEGLLVIDQPEDDLDNAFIANDILPAIHELKDKQQIIFATHNANMLVNGESEKIVVLDTEPRPATEDGQSSIRGKIEHEGGIDQKDLREAVTGILEGGRDAFLARERKYRFRPT
jgi:ATPase subunit of ABC transporter with duplicated ATPase domains